VRARLAALGESRVELLEPLGEEHRRPLFLATRGPGMHHVAYEVNDLEEALAELTREAQI